MESYPIKLTYHVREYSFGERLIPEKLGKENLPDGVVAETWEISDYRDTTGTVTNGPYAGRTLHDLAGEFPDELVGQGWRGPHFPILFKFLDASHMLPVHLHPDDETARTKHGEPHGKSEAWHILWAEPGASILAGIKEGFSRDDLFDAFKRQDYDAVMPRYGIRTGDTVYVPGGILHTFGPGTLICEVQQTSDLGQFVMPEDLYGNRLDEDQWNANIEATLDELKTDFMPRPNPGLALEDGTNRRVFCCAGPHFALERWTLREAHSAPSRPDRSLILSNVGEGSVQLRYGGGVGSLGRAESCILPAAIGEVGVVPDGEASVVVCYVPDLEKDVVGPLREAGHSDGEIRGLGEVEV
ncbi:mannose-6-phosphate isomerase [Rubrobacter tropicus]|uniref:Mannose-6-phosphate isomerase n=1 Tax=Rubrobacter tropicus TaxID=2653851 RepID=A0A6G8QBF0_9ACTN|nr:type I phosphomannose isomerase catalytic subunit [Rubrobacter tropicus]QIN83752.1 mannose-6-phosphate isomerase [Rubrobacter tropicus]